MLLTKTLSPQAVGVKDLENRLAPATAECQVFFHGREELNRLRRQAARRAGFLVACVGFRNLGRVPESHLDHLYSLTRPVVNVKMQLFLR